MCVCAVVEMELEGVVCNDTDILYVYRCVSVRSILLLLLSQQQ